MNTSFEKRWGSKKGKIVALSVVSVFFFLFGTAAFAQQIKAGVDTTQIRIGEQITYQISVEADPSDLVVFPEGQTFSPLEMIESYAIDTGKIKDRYRLLKEYALTQFDSGHYSIPRQKVIINDQSFFTDSISVAVNDVVVDTAKQKMFPIKPSVEVPPAFSVPNWVWWLLGGILVIGLIILLFFRRKKRKEAAAQKLPPYEQALFELKELDNSHLLEQKETKEYYSKLSEAVRRYLDGEVYDHAMESTTNELIAYLEAERDRGRLHLEHTTIERLKVILQRADLAKFANSRPDVITAREDRSSVENVINDTKASIPQPTEEELLKDRQYREKLAHKKRAKKIAVAVAAVVVLLSAGVAFIISTRGVEYFSDTFLGNESKDLLEGDWVRSEYGTPPVTITTPDVLVRDLSDTTGIAAGKESFRYGSLRHLYAEVNTRPAGQNFKLESAVEEVYSYLESQGAKNIITKQEDVSTLNGAEGLKIFGTMSLPAGDEKLVQKHYTIFNFAEGGGFQQIVVIYDQDDTYADEIAQRITSSVELRNAQN